MIAPEVYNASLRSRCKFSRILLCFSLLFSSTPYALSSVFVFTLTFRGLVLDFNDGNRSETERAASEHVTFDFIIKENEESASLVPGKNRSKTREAQTNIIDIDSIKSLQISWEDYLSFKEKEPLALAHGTTSQRFHIETEE